ncbi:MAG: hypothetical protein NW201_07740 [Gemmatimonadales bacterium]|nr:hypothetical protein [Gemmatimonadales bacterium]
MTPRSLDEAEAMAAMCERHGVPLHLIGPLPFSWRTDGWKLRDCWDHETWFQFRDAISRERCVYFGTNAEGEPGDAPIEWNSVIVVPSDGVLPDRILEKHPERCYRLADGMPVAEAVAGVLKGRGGVA